MSRSDRFAATRHRWLGAWLLGRANAHDPTRALACVLAALALAMPSFAAAKEKPASAARERSAILAAVTSWGYQLRIHDLAPLAASAFDLIVIDHGLAARRNGKLLFDASEIAALKTKPDGRRRIVLAYLSIGEAEQYRYYWRPEWCRRATAPAWIGAVNPNWPGNYPVRFWDPDWQRLILGPGDSYLDRIMAQGFDGIYLDRADVYVEWSAIRQTAARDMIAFLGRIATHARVRDPRFLIVMQNAEELLIHARARGLLDAVAKEDLLHGLEFSEAANDAASIAGSLAHLRRARAAGLPVFAVEYLADPTRIAAARQRLAGFGFVPYFGPRLLDRLVTPGVAADPAPPSRPGEPISAGPIGEGGPTCLLD